MIVKMDQNPGMPPSRKRSSSLQQLQKIILSLSLITMIILGTGIGFDNSVKLFSGSSPNIDPAVLPRSYALTESELPTQLQDQQQLTTDKLALDSCRCVVFRFDDIQDHFAQPGQI